MLRQRHVARESQLFEVFKSVGHVISRVPAQFCFSPDVSCCRIYTAVGNSFHSYRFPWLTEDLVGPQLSTPITTLSALRYFGPELNIDASSSDAESSATDVLFVTSSGRPFEILVFRQAELICVLGSAASTPENPAPHTSPIVFTYVLGRSFLLSIGSSGQYVLWDLVKILSSETETPSQETDSDSRFFVEPPDGFQFQLPGDSTITCVSHVSGYLDKILLGTREGHVDIFNFGYGKLVYRIRFGAEETERDEAPSELMGRVEKNVAVTCLSSNPPGVLDVVAVGFSDGTIRIHDIRKDTTLRVFRHERSLGRDRIGSVITSLAFYESFEYALLASGSADGSVALWNVAKGQCVWFGANIHCEKALTTLRFAEDERGDVLITAGADNALHVFSFVARDVVASMSEVGRKKQGSGSGALVRREFSAEGHSEGVGRVRFYGDRWFLSTGIGSDRQIRLTNVQTAQSRRLAQKNPAIGPQDKQQQFTTPSQQQQQGVNDLFLPPVTEFDFCLLRADDWDNMVSVHFNMAEVRSWNIKHGSLGATSFYIPQSYGIATSVCISPCGNFTIIGRSSGRLEKWMLQSHRFDSCFFRNEERNAHDGAVTGVATDAVMSILVSGGFDAVVRIWQFKTRVLLQEIVLGAPVARIVRNQLDTMLAIATDGDFALHLFDLVLLKVVRVFRGIHSNRITDVCFSHDNRYVVSCGMDSFIIVWDIVSTHVVDWIHAEKPAVSVDWHPEGLYLATSHVGEIGVCLWSCKLVFGAASLQPVDMSKGPTCVKLPSFGEAFLDFVEEEEATPDESMSEEPSLSDEKDEKSDLVRFSGLPIHLLRAIPFLDLIRERNRPSSRKRKRAVPFFLPTLSLPGKRMRFDVPQEESQKREEALFGGIEEEEGEVDSGKMDVDSVPTSGPDLFFVEEDEEDQPDSETPDQSRAESSEDGDAVMHDGPSRRELQKLFDEEPTSEFARLLRADDSFRSAADHLARSSLRNLDISIRSLSTYAHLRELKLFLQFVHYQLSKGNQFDLIQVVLNLFLKVFGETIMSSKDDDEIFECLAKVHHLQVQKWGRLESLLKNDLCLVKMLTFMQFLMQGHEDWVWSIVGCWKIEGWPKSTVTAPSCSPLPLLLMGQRLNGDAPKAPRGAARPGQGSKANFRKLVGETHFDMGEITDLYQQFVSISASQEDDGLIDKDEFKEALGLKDSLFVDRMFTLFDEDGDGNIDFDEFVSGMSVFSEKGTIEEKTRFSFKMYDFDGDGFISKDELYKLLEASLLENSLGIPESQLTDLIEATFGQADTDGDGQISYEEYESMVEKNPSMLSNISITSHKRHQ